MPSIEMLFKCSREITLAIVLPMFFGVEGALFSAPIADVGTLIAVVIMSAMTLKELNAKVSKEPAAEPITDAA